MKEIRGLTFLSNQLGVALDISEMLWSKLNIEYIFIPFSDFYLIEDVFLVFLFSS